MEVDFSAQIKARNLSFASKPVEFEGFKLSERGKAFLSVKSPNEKIEVLASVVQNGFEAAKNYFRPKVSDFEVAIARLNKFLTSPKSELLTAGFVNLDDVEVGLARVAIAQHRLTEADFREAKAEVEVTIEQEDDGEDEGETCDCEDPEMEDSADGMTKTCGKCGKKMAKAKKNC